MIGIFNHVFILQVKAWARHINCPIAHTLFSFNYVTFRFIESTSHFTGDPATPIESEFEEDPQKNKKRDLRGAAYDENTSNQGTDYFNRFHKLMDDDVT